MARINEEQVKRVAEFLKANPPKAKPLNFYSVIGKDGQEIVLDKMYPPLNHPQAIDFFFFTMIHNYGFWYGDSRGYSQPMVGKLDGKLYKGSDLLWRLFMRAFNQNPEFFSPCFLSTISPSELGAIFFNDDPGTQWPDFDTRFALTRRYGQILRAENITPSELVTLANKSNHRLREFIDSVSMIAPYGLDPWKKKLTLLAMALANRPEHFLKVHRSDEEEWRPIVDYHLMRVALRLGLVEVDDVEWTHEKLIERRWLNESEEESIRQKVFLAIQKAIVQSGLSMSAIDVAFWLARKYCPEMSEPECGKCMFNSLCAKRTELFQPVLRTTNY